MVNSKCILFLKCCLCVWNKFCVVNVGCVCLLVYCLNKNISVQLIDDEQGIIFVVVLIFEKDLGFVGKNNIEVVIKVGQVIVECVKVVGVIEVYFDCGGFLFYGKVKVLVDVVCEVGLKI